MEPGNSVLVYTDGMTESFSNGNEYGENRLIDSFVQSEAHSADKILENLFSDHDSFMKSEKPSDDVTVAVLKKI